MRFAEEVIIDSIKDVSRTIEEVHSRTELVVEPGAAHEDFIMDSLLGYKEEAAGTKLIEEWLASRL